MKENFRVTVEQSLHRPSNRTTKHRLPLLPSVPALHCIIIRHFLSILRSASRTTKITCLSKKLVQFLFHYRHCNACIIRKNKASDGIYRYFFAFKGMTFFSVRKASKNVIALFITARTDNMKIRTFGRPVQFVMIPCRVLCHHQRASDAQPGRARLLKETLEMMLKTFSDTVLHCISCAKRILAEHFARIGAGKHPATRIIPQAKKTCGKIQTFENFRKNSKMAILASSGSKQTKKRVQGPMTASVGQECSKNFLQAASCNVFSEAL